MIRDPGFHGRGHAEGLMNAGEVVVHEMQGNRGAVSSSKCNEVVDGGPFGFEINGFTRAASATWD